MNITISNRPVFKTQEVSTHTVLTIFYMFREILRIKSVQIRTEV